MLVGQLQLTLQDSISMAIRGPQMHHAAPVVSVKVDPWRFISAVLIQQPMRCLCNNKQQAGHHCDLAAVHLQA